MTDNHSKYSNKEYTPAQLEYFKSQEEIKEYFAKKVEQTLSSVQQYIQDKKASGEQLELRNNHNTKYYLMEDGTIFKYLNNELEFYRLDTRKFVWYIDPSLLDLYFDNTLTFKEIPDFQDYFLEQEKNDTKSGTGINL